MTSKSFTFASTHAPTWGDFYAKDGVNRRNNQSFDVYAYNSGFLQADPLINFTQIGFGNLTTLQHTGERANHIAIPDTLNLRPPDFTPVPEASAGLVLFGLFGAAVSGSRRNRKATATVG